MGTGHGNTCVSFDRSGKFLLVTRYWESGVSVLPWNPADGTIGEVCCAPQHSGSGPHPLRQSIPHPHGIHADPVSDIIYAMDLGNDKVVQYTLEASGNLAPLSEVDMGPESGPWQTKHSPLHSLRPRSRGAGGKEDIEANLII